jgi:ribosome-binding protein aMBF1 (putative translation factor)
VARDWALTLVVERAKRRWSQEDLSRACAEANEDTWQMWRMLLWGFESGRSVPAPEQAAILERVLELPSAEGELGTP